MKRAGWGHGSSPPPASSIGTRACSIPTALSSLISDPHTLSSLQSRLANQHGSHGFEGLVLVYATHDGSILARSQGKSDERKRFTFGWTANIIAVVTLTRMALIQSLPGTTCGWPTGFAFRSSLSPSAECTCMTLKPRRSAWCRMGWIGSNQRN